MVLEWFEMFDDSQNTVRWMIKLPCHKSQLMIGDNLIGFLSSRVGRSEHLTSQKLFALAHARLLSWNVQLWTFQNVRLLLCANGVYEPKETPNILGNLCIGECPEGSPLWNLRALFELKFHTGRLDGHFLHKDLLCFSCKVFLVREWYGWHSAGW